MRAIRSLLVLIAISRVYIHISSFCFEIDPAVVEVALGKTMTPVCIGNQPKMIIAPLSSDIRG